VARRPLDREGICLDCGRRATQLKRDSLGRSPVNMRVDRSIPLVVSGLIAFVGISCDSAPRPIQEVSGCYAVTMGAWVLHPHNASRPTAPPDTIRLSTEPAPAANKADRYRVEPHAFDSLARGAASWWTRRGDSVIIVWSVAFASVDLLLTATDSELIGSVRSQTDIVITDENGQIPWPSAPVTLRRSRCPRAAA